MLVNVPAPVVVTAVAADALAKEAGAPQPQQMSAVHLDDIQNGWYALEGCPTCCCMKIAFNRDKSAFTWGPCCCWNLPIPCVAPDAFKAQSTGSTTFTSTTFPHITPETYIWQTPTRFYQPVWDNYFVKWC